MDDLSVTTFTHILVQVTWVLASLEDNSIITWARIKFNPKEIKVFAAEEGTYHLTIQEEMLLQRYFNDS